MAAFDGGGQRANETINLGPERPATAMDTSTLPANNSPVLREDPTDGRFVVLANRVDAPAYVCRLHLSGDGGGTWAPADPVPRLPDGAEKCFGGEVAFDAQGRLYYLFVGLVGGGNEPMGAFLTTSSDRGRTFSPPRQVLGPLNFSVRMAIDRTAGSQGRMHLVWLRATSDPPSGGFGPPPNPIMSAYSDDGGATFSQPVQISDRGRQRVVAPALTLGADHRVHVAYYDLLDDARDYQGLEGPVWDGHWSLVATMSQDGGRSFEAGVVVEAEVVPPSRVMAIYIMPPPALAAEGDIACLGWTDARAGDPDVWARCSTDGGRSWRPAQRINDDPAQTGRWQYLPGISIAPSGRVDVVFYDRRKDRQNINNDVMYSYSTDGGRAFHRNVQLNREGSSLSAIGVQYTVASSEGQWDLGSRMGLLSREDDVVAAWTDTRNSAPLTTAQDIFTTVISGHGATRTISAGSLAAGVALLAAGVVGAMRSRRRRPRPVIGLSTAMSSLVVVLSILLSSCDGATPAAPVTSARLPLPPAIVRVMTHDDGFEVLGSLRSGRVVFEVVNVGTQIHDPGLVAIDAAAPPIDEYLKQTDRPWLKGFAGANPRAPGRTATFAVDLAPGGRYALLCFARTTDGKRHFEQGMTWEGHVEE